MSIVHRTFRDYSPVALEILVLFLTIIPILILVYFYPFLPDRVPEYLNLRGDVEVWGSKSFLSVFRLPLMALDLQLLCLLAKYATWQSINVSNYTPASDHERSLKLSLNLFDWFRAFIAVKLASSSLEVIVFGIERYQYLTKFTRATSWISSVLGVGGALVYSYRLLMVNRRLKAPSTTQQTNRRQSFFYFNPSDPMWFSETHAPNFGNKWLYVFLLCLVALPFLMLWPMLSH